MRRRAPLALVLMVLGLAGAASSQPAVDLDEAVRAIQQATRDYNDGQLARAIEALTPVLDPALQADLDEILEINLADDCLAWTMHDARWTKPASARQVDTHLRLQQLALDRRRD